MSDETSSARVEADIPALDGQGSWGPHAREALSSTGAYVHQQLHLDFQRGEKRKRIKLERLSLQLY